MEDFPGNSKRANTPSREQPAVVEKGKRLQKVVEGEVVRRKKPFNKRMKELLVGGDGPTVWEYVMVDIFIPGIRDMFADIVTGGIERALYGESRSSHRRGGGARFGSPPGRVNYNGFASPPVGRGPANDARPVPSRRERATHDFEWLYFPNRPDAEAVLDGMYTHLDQYQVVTVSNFYDLANVSSNYTDERYGWTDLLGTRIERVRNGQYIIDLPAPVLLER